MSDTFEFDDNAHVGRLTGTLHDPKATPGYVLTVQGDGSVAAAPGGGSGGGAARWITHDVICSAMIEQAGPGFRFAPVHTLAIGDVLVAACVIRLVDSNDANAGALTVGVEDDGNNFFFSSTDDGTTPNVTNAPGFIVGAAPAGTYPPPDPLIIGPSVATSAFVVGLGDNGSMAGDGTTGTWRVYLLVSTPDAV